MRKLIYLALLLVVLGLFSACGDDNNSTVIRQVVLYGATLGSKDLGPSNLVVLNPNTGAYIKTVGSIGYRVNGLTWDRTDGKLYASTTSHDPLFPDGLIEINQHTGAGTPIGAGWGVDNVNLVTVNSSGDMFAWTEYFDDLVSADKTAGTATRVGESGLSTSETGLNFDKDNVLWLINGGAVSYTINTATGNATFVAPLPVPRAHHGDFHPTTGLYWGIDETDYSADGAPARNLYVLDLRLGTLENTLPTADYLHAISFAYKWVYLSR
jgi:hypothetical protein